jgi:hypothetical protein
MKDLLEELLRDGLVPGCPEIPQNPLDHAASDHVAEVHQCAVNRSLDEAPARAIDGGGFSGLFGAFASAAEPAP